MSAQTINRPQRHQLRDRIALLIARRHAQRTFARFMRDTRDPRAIQRGLLHRHVRAHRDSAFGKDHGFSEIRSYADFARCVPVSDYEYHRPYVDRVKQGETTALFRPGTRVQMFAKTSGTTAQPKYIPVTDAFLADYRRGWNVFGIKVIADHDCFLRPIVQVVSPMDEEHTSAGIPCGAITGLMAATQKRLVRRYYVVPQTVAYIADAAARYYTVMRFAISANVGFLITANPATLLKLARAVDEHPERLVRDLRDGSLSADLPIAADLRGKLCRQLQPDRDTARRLDAILQHSQRLLPRDYWQLAFLANWSGGTMGLYLRDFPEYFGGTPVRDIGLLASEGRMSIPIEDGTASGVLSIADQFFEFIPEEEYGKDDATVLTVEQLEADRNYFILLTNSAGLRRYDIGDCVRVTGFFNQTPLIEFLHKGAHTSSLAGEKLSENQVVRAFDAASSAAGSPPRLFVLAARWAQTPYYCLHIEPGPGETAAQRSELALATTLDGELKRINNEYAGKRASLRLGPVQINIVPQGYLAQRDQAAASLHRAANEQFKHQYLLPTVDADAEFPTLPTG